MSELEDALRAGAARWILRAVARDMRAQERANGGRPSFPAHVQRALELIEAIAAESLSSEPGTTSGTVSDVVITGMAPAAVAAEQAGCSDGYARRLARQKRVRCYSAGANALLIDVESLRGVLRGSNRRSS